MVPLRQRRGAEITNVVVKKNGVDITVTDPTELEPAIMANNHKRFHLTDDTPLMGDSEMNKELGFLGANQAAEQILNGTYIFQPGADANNRLTKAIGSCSKSHSR